jgi:hypothetical protein
MKPGDKVQWSTDRGRGAAVKIVVREGTIQEILPDGIAKIKIEGIQKHLYLSVRILTKQEEAQQQSA